MKVGPKYKLARRLGAGIFEKTQTQKFAVSASKRVRPVPGANPKSSYAIGQMEKQRTRYTYQISAKQLTNYVRDVIASKSSKQVDDLFAKLESRLDSVAARSGLAKTRSMARQMVSHGHFLVNGVRTTVPSYHIKKGDVITVREGSKSSSMFTELDKRIKDAQIPGWITTDAKTQTAKVTGSPSYKPDANPFDLSKVLEFYKR
jgi:small subunit ribosomal protein S4